MAYKNFVPEFWAEKIEKENEKLLVLAPLTNRNWEGQLLEKGDAVNILGLAKPTIGDYDGGDIAEAETLEDTAVKLTIDKAKYFNVIVDDIDKRQAQQSMMEDILNECNESMADTEDADIGAIMADGAGITIDIEELTQENARKFLQEGKTKLLKNGVKNSSTICAAVTPEFLERIEQAVEKLDTDNTSVVTNGFVGKTSGVEIYVSNNLPLDADGNDQCFLFTKRAVAHAKQVAKVEAYRPQGKFCDAVKGLSLYGSKVVRPKELVKFKIEDYA